MAEVHPQIGWVNSLTNVFPNGSSEINIQRKMFKENTPLSLIEADGPFLVIYWPKKSIEAKSTSNGGLRIKNKGILTPRAKWTVLNKEVTVSPEHQARADSFLSKVGLKVI